MTTVPPPSRFSQWLERLRLFSFWMLVVSAPVSISGIEIGKVLFILSALVSFLLSPFWVWKREMGPWARLNLTLFGLLSLCLLLSFLFTEKAGNMSRGTLRVLPVVLSQWLLAVTLLHRPVSAPKSFLPLLALGLSMAVSMTVSIFGADGGRSHGLVGHPVVHGHLLALMFTWSLLLGVFGWKLSSIRWRILVVAGSVVLLGLAVRDIRLNDSRSLMMPLLLVPLALTCLLFAHRWRLLLWVPALSLLLIFSLPASLVEKAKYHLHLYFQAPDIVQVQQATWTETRLEVTFRPVHHAPTNARIIIFPGGERRWAAPMPAGGGLLRVGFDALPVYESGPFEVTFFSPGGTGRPHIEQKVSVWYHHPHRPEPKIEPARSATVGHFFPWWRMRFSFFENHRLAVWSSSLAMAEAHPWLGVGPGNWNWGAKRPVQNAVAGRLRFECGDQPIPFHGHSNFLTLLAESGLPAAFLYGILVVSLLFFHFLTLWRARRAAPPSPHWHWHLAVFTTFLVTVLMGIFDYTLFGVAGSLHWASLGLLLFLGMKSPRPHGNP